MIPVTHQLKPAPKKVERRLLRREAIEAIKTIYDINLFPSDYLITHQESDEATKEKIKKQAAERNKRRAEKRARLALNQDVSDLLICAGQRHLLRDRETRLQAEKFLVLRSQSQPETHTDSTAT